SGLPVGVHLHRVARGLLGAGICHRGPHGPDRARDASETAGAREPVRPAPSPPRPLLMGPIRPGNYALQAETYDRTRGASPTVVRLMSKHLGPSEGRRLLDIA